jgi:hypothetical protein
LVPVFIKVENVPLNQIICKNIAIISARDMLVGIKYKLQKRSKLVSLLSFKCLNK